MPPTIRTGMICWPGSAGAVELGTATICAQMTQRLSSRGSSMSERLGHENLLRMNEVAARLAISVRQLRQLIADGSLPYVNVGRGLKRPSYRFRPADIREFVSARVQTAAARPRLGTGRRSKMLKPIEVIDFAQLRAEARAKRKHPTARTRPI